MRTALALILAVAFLIMVPSWSPAAVKVTLKNGRSFIADFCREVTGKMLCDLQGGTLEIPRRDIADIRELSTQRISPGEETAPESDAAAEEKKASASPEDEKKELSAQTGESRLMTGLTPEQAKQLDMINEKKAAMRAERESLVTEREQLYADVKNAGVMKNQEQIDEIKKRIAALGVRIEGFNEAVRKLNAEEESILKR